ncbi:MAG: hypothetical protein PHQ42_00355, partial [Patescibacteria group bacterium]|nr:hypothetical protein [Patescibacteria group bacterium]
MFINMPLRETALPNTPPYGPALLASILRKYEADVVIVDLNGYRVKDELAERRGLANGRHLTEEEVISLLRKYLSKYGEQDLIALSGLITTLDWQKRLAKIARNLQPKAFLVSGGGLATEFGKILFDWIPELDGIAAGEGDEVIVKIAFDAKIIKNRGWQSALNAGQLSPYYLGEINGRHRFCYLGARPDNLDALPFPAW